MTKITIDRALIEQAIDSVKDFMEYREMRSPSYLRDALRAALTAPAVESVGQFMQALDIHGEAVWVQIDADLNVGQPLYTSPPPPAEPARTSQDVCTVPLLSDEELAAIVSEAERTYLSDMNGSWRKALMVATEQAVRRKAGL